MNTANWISLFQALGTVAVGIIAGRIAWLLQSKQIDIAKGMKEISNRQHETAETKLRLDLFQQRFKVYESVIKCLDENTAYKNTTFKDDFDLLQLEYKNACVPVKYLFDTSVHNYLIKDVPLLMQSFFDAHILLTNCDYNDDKRGERKEKYNLAYTALINVYEEFDNKVEKYLKVQKSFS